MARGSRKLEDEDARRLAKLWTGDSRFGTRYRFAARMAEIINETQTPRSDQIKAADKRLERLEKRKAKLTNPTANAIALVVGLSREVLEVKIFGEATAPAPDALPPKERPPSEAEKSTYRHFEIIHEYDIKDIRGRLTGIKTAERVEVLRREVVVGGSYWESYPMNLKAWYKPARRGDLPWQGAMPVEVTRLEKTGKIYRWDTYHEPALLRGDVVWFLTAFELKDEFTSEVCRDAFHSMQEIGSFTWRIKFPPQRPAKRWWITVDYHPSLPSNTTLASYNEKTTTIDWSISGLPKDVVYFINWEW
jgi:hypothetical protein